jgi:glycosyltransferase involved in cell wall biosynthesis
MTVNVLWLTKGLGLGGAERLLTLMAPRLDTERFRVEVAYLLPWKDAFVPTLQASGVGVSCLGATRNVDLRWVDRLRRLVRSNAYDIVHTHSPVPAVAARLVVPRSTTLVHTEHNLWERYRAPTRYANALTYARNDAVIAVSDGVAASIRSEGPFARRTRPVETLLHGVDPRSARSGPEARRLARERLGIDPEAPVIGNVANLTAKKDHRALLAAFRGVHERLPAAELVLVGTGPLDGDIRAAVADADLEGSVHMLGARSDVDVLLPGFDVFVLSSRFEGLPISMLEAMASEVACVVTAVGGIPEVVTDGVDGRLVPPSQPERLAEALLDVLEDATVRAELAASGRRRVEDAFSIDRAIRRTEELYAGLLGSG